MDIETRYFAQKVALMRMAQKKYFNSRTPDNLAQAKYAEGQVDTLLGKLEPELHEVPKGKQRKLFLG